MTRAFNASANDLRGGWQPALSLELAFAELLEPERTPGSVPVAPAESRAPRPAPSAPPRAKPAQPAPRHGPEPGEAQASVAPATKSSAQASEPPARPSEKPSEAFSLEQVAAAWKEMMPVLKRDHPQLEALLRSARSHELLDGVLVLGFASDVLASKMQSPEMMEPARQALSAALGADLPIRCIVAPGSGKSAPPDVKPDGMVAAALQNGGEIVDIQ